jgi:hypothetical protein
MLASCPASILNHFSTPLGIPFRFGFTSSRSRHSRDRRWNRAEMSIQRETLRLKQHNLKGTQLCKDVLVVLPTEHILRGFVFERTLVKEMYYLWRVIMSPGHLSYLRKVKGPREFLKHVNWMAGNTMVNFRIDLALTHYMVGNVAECIKLFESIPLESLPPKLHACVVPFATELRTSPEDAASRVQSWERENIERLGLAEAVTGTVEATDTGSN